MDTNIPTGWKLIPLGKCITEVKERNEDLEKVPVLSVTNRRGFVLSEEYFDRRVYSHNLQKYKIIRKGQFAYNPSRLNVGSIARLHAYRAGLLSPLYVVFKVLSNINEKFLVFWLNSAKAKNYIKARTQGTVRDIVSYSTLSSIPILLPPLIEQKKITAILERIETTIEKTDILVNQISKVKKALMQQLLFKGLPKKHKKFKKTSIGMIPAEWKLVKLEHLCHGKPEYGANVPALDYNPTLPRYVRITDISEDGKLLPGTWASISHTSAEGYLLSDEDVLLARSGATVGKSYLYKRSDGKCAYAGYLIRVKPDKSKLLSTYLFHFTHSPYYYKWIKRIIRAGAQPNINAKEYAALKVPLPSLEEQSRISTLFTLMDRYKETNIIRMNTLLSLKSALLQSLLTGELRV